jgi:hypothetical protein
MHTRPNKTDFCDIHVVYGSSTLRVIRLKSLARLPLGLLGQQLLALALLLLLLRLDPLGRRQLGPRCLAPILLDLALQGELVLLRFERLFGFFLAERLEQNLESVGTALLLFVCLATLRSRQSNDQTNST